MPAESEADERDVHIPPAQPRPDQPDYHDQDYALFAFRENENPE